MLEVALGNAVVQDNNLTTSAVEAVTTAEHTIMVGSLQNALPGQIGVSYQSNDTGLTADSKRVNSLSIGKGHSLCGFGFFEAIGAGLASEIAEISPVADCLFIQLSFFAQLLVCKFLLVF